MESAHGNLFEGCIEVLPDIEPSQSCRQLPHCKGVILFSDASDTPILLLIAADIKRLALNRLALADTTVATRRVKLAEITRKIYYLCCWCDFNSALKHYQLAKKLFASRYADFVTLAKLWYIKINTTAKWPFFSVTQNPQPGENFRVFGPFPSRKAAGDYIEALVDGFALCRQQSLIDDMQKAPSCPYYQMHICGAPCAGKITRDEYLGRVRDAVKAAGGISLEYIKKFEELMKELSSKMEFEQAQIVKKQIENIRQLENEKFRWISDIEQIALLHIDKGPKIKIKGHKKKTQNFMAFLIRAGQIAHLENFSLEQIGQLLENVKLQISNPGPQVPDPELISIFGLSLYRSKTSGLWFDLKRMPGPEELTQRLKNLVNDDSGTDENISGDKH